MALPAPVDQLFVATEVNEWALCASLLDHDPQRWHDLQEALVVAAMEEAEDRDVVIPPVLEESAAMLRFERLAALEIRPRLTALLDVAAERKLQYILDDDTLTLGGGATGSDFGLTALPTVAAVPWSKIHSIPTAIVTGSNGKTTTVRLLASCARAWGLKVAYSSTDGVFLDDELIEAGDYSGPAGARLAMRESRAQAAVLETARGGILRRGIAISRPKVAVVTNVSSDHFGEYGIDDLEALADVKLTVASIVPPDGLLVLNGDDDLIRAKANGLALRWGRCPPLGWFALDAQCPALREHRSRGGSTCGAHGGHLHLSQEGVESDLGSLAAMPLTVGERAIYNIANLAGAALAAAALGIPPATIAEVFATFGTDPADNMGRMMRFDYHGARVLLDYAHNPEGLRGLLQVADQLRTGDRKPGRLALVLGHAGNRQDIEIRHLAAVAAQFHPALVVVKENETYLRGREPGEVPRIIRDALVEAGMAESALQIRMSEVEAATSALEWLQPGDVLALPIHSAPARAAVLAILANS